MIERPYIAGPMSNIPQYNVPAFLAADKDLRDRGLRPILPADLQDPAHIEALLASDGKTSATGATWGDWLALDVKLVADEADSVVVLPGWRQSRGARLESFAAHVCNKPILSYPSLSYVPYVVLTEAWTHGR